MLRTVSSGTRSSLAPFLLTPTPSSATLALGSRDWYAPAAHAAASTASTVASHDEEEACTYTGLTPSSSLFNRGVTPGNAFGRSLYNPSSAFVRHTHSITAPTFEKVRKDGPDVSRRSFAYLMAGTGAFFGITGAKYAVRDLVDQMNASQDVLALASVEVDMSEIPVGSGVVIKWRGKPIFIRRRKESEIADATSVNLSELRDPQHDSERAQKPEYLVLLGVCTHLGCVPLADQGKYNGWFCPCHGSHYDISGRIRLGPAPLNLEVPPYKYTSDKTILIG